ncbi:MAG TPA: carbohydrate kinase family protein [Arenibaculum sp.]|nr:carbohydrate kinase family protein [Arenibaculum sp.]
MEAAILCIGAAHTDRKARAAEPVVPGTSNPVSVRSSTGGVARNVAENLARLGMPVALMSRIGQDREGDAVLAGLEAVGVDCALVERSPSSPTASYTALLDPAGELFVAMADMAIYGEMQVRLLARSLPALARFGAWFVDCNLPTGSLRFLLENRPANVRLFVDPVSVTKAERLRGLLGGIETLFANREELSALTGLPIRAPLDLCAAAGLLLDRGVGSVVGSRGADGCLLATPQEYTFLPPVPAEVRDVTGAGDALIAGTILGRLRGLPVGGAVRVGLACAALAVESRETVYPGLTPETAFARAGIAPALA